jgi:hypothetical protein
MKKDDYSYCGLNCATCKDRFKNIRNKINELDTAFETVNIKEMARAIPFMNSKYRGYGKMADFFKNECSGCRKGGGNPFCGIRKCSKKKGYFTCVECNSDLCNKFKSLLKIHNDNEIQNNRELIKQLN